MRGAVVMVSAAVFASGCGADVTTSRPPSDPKPDEDLERRCNADGDVVWLRVDSVAGGIEPTAVDGLGDGIVIAARSGRATLLQRRASDGGVAAELIGDGEPCGFARASAMVAGPDGVTLAGTLKAPFWYGGVGVDGQGCDGTSSAYVLTTTVDLEPTTFSHYLSGGDATVPASQSELHDLVRGDGAWISGWFRDEIDLDGQVVEGTLEEDGLVMHRDANGVIDRVLSIPSASKAFIGGLRNGWLSIGWWEEGGSGDVIHRRGLWDPNTDFVWTQPGYNPLLPVPDGWLDLGPTTAIFDDSGEVVVEASIYGVGVSVAAFDTNAAGQLVIAGYFDDVVELPGCTLETVAPLSLFVAVLNADLSLRHARVLGRARDGPAETYWHSDIPTNRIRAVHLDDSGGAWIVADVQLPVDWTEETVMPTMGTPQCEALGGTTETCVSRDMAILRLAP